MSPYGVSALQWGVHARGPVVALSLVLACATPTTGGGDGTDTDTDTDTDVDTSAGFVVEDETGGETGLTPVDSHEEDIQPYWSKSCVIYCHDGDPETEAGILDLQYGAAYDAIVTVQATQVDMPLITPGSLEDSYLWHKLRSTHPDLGGSGEQMPLFAPPLDAETMERIETWIMIGAPP